MTQRRCREAAWPTPLLETRSANSQPHGGEIVWMVVTLDIMVRPLPLDSHVEIPFDSTVRHLLREARATVVGWFIRMDIDSETQLCISQ